MQTFTLINTGASLDANVIVNKGAKVFGIDCMNNSGTVAFFKLYDTSITPTNAMTPIRRYMIPTNGGLVRLFSQGLIFTAGIGFLISGGISDNDNTNIGASIVLVNVDWN